MAGYIGTTPVPQATQHRESFTATGGQTSFATAGYTPQFIDVYLNGVKLAPADYTATNGSDVVLASGATASDILEIVAYTPFEVANQTFTGDTSVTNLAVTGTFTSRGIDDNADAVAITIDSSENVGIGTSSPLGRVTIANAAGANAPTSVTAANTYLQLGSDDFGPSNNGKFMIGFGYTDATNTNSPAYIGYEEVNTSGDTYGNLTFYTRNVTTDTAPSERMRLDSSGNLLVGTTNTSLFSTSTVEGLAYLAGGGQLTVSRNSAQPYIANRLGTDGTLFDFRKDGTTVGSIGVAQSGDRTYFAGGTYGIAADTSETTIMPCGTTGTGNDGVVNLGKADARFKDLYLSGGIYLGGTGAANKLDDYEEGTWTVYISDAASGGNIGSGTTTGYYTKIGRQVWVQAGISTSSGDLSAMTSSNTLYIQGLPFTSNSVSENRSQDIWLRGVSYGSGNVPYAYISSNTAAIYFAITANNTFNFNPIEVSGYSGGDQVYVNIMYWI